MGINRFDSPAQDKYISTYVPLPYEQIMATVATRQAQLDREQDMMNKTYEDTKNLKYIPGTKNEEYVREYINKSGDLVNKYIGSDMSDPIVKQQMHSEFRNITDRTKLQNIHTNWENWSNNNKVRQQLVATGKYSPYLDEDPARNPEFGAKDEIYNYTTPQFESYLPEAKAFWSNVKPGLLKDPKTGAFKQTAEGYHLSGYNDPDLKDYAKLNWGTFAETSTGRNWITSELRARGLEENDVNRQEIAQELLWNQRPQGGPNLEGSREPNDISGSGSGSKRGVWDPTTTDQNIRSSKGFDVFNIGDIQFKDGKVHAPEKYKTANYSFGYGAMSGQIPVSKETEEKRKQIELEQIAKINYIKSKIPEFANLTDEQAYNGYMQVTKDLASFEDLPKINIDSDAARKGWASNIMSNMTDRKAQIYDDKQRKVEELRDLSDREDNAPLKQLGYTQIEFKRELGNFISGKDSKVTVGAIAQNGALPGMVIVELIPNKGKDKTPRKLYVSTNNDMNRMFTPLQEMYNKLKTFTSGLVDVGGVGRDGEVIYIEPGVSKDANTGEWKYSPSIWHVEIKRDESGKPVVDPTTGEPFFTPITRVTASGVSQKFIGEFKDSGYMGTGITVSNDSY